MSCAGAPRCTRGGSDSESCKTGGRGVVVRVWVAAGVGGLVAEAPSLPGGGRRAACLTATEGRCGAAELDVHYDGHYDATPKGLMNAITDGKRVMKRYREDGLCPDCATPDRKRLRGAGLPYCSPCIIKKSLAM